MPDGVPHAFHRIWLGNEPIPEQSELFWHFWRAYNPACTFITWTSANLPTLQNQMLFDDATTWAEKSDIARLEIINTFGGIYIDTDFQCLKPFWPLLSGISNFAGYEHAGSVNNALFGAAPGGAWLTAAIEQLPAWAAAHASEWPPTKTGPVFFTNIINQFPEVVVYEPEKFYPWQCHERWGNPTPFIAADHPNSWAVHHWDASWCWAWSDGAAYYSQPTTEAPPQEPEPI
jgi:mannosyltransferase OCH1-like enzyme